MEIDYTKGHRTWGHDMSATLKRKRRWYGKRYVVIDGCLWNSQSPKVGDTLKWSAESGTVVARFTRVEGAPSVWDMYFFEAVVVEVRP